jgi:hypothetical protein
MSSYEPELKALIESLSCPEHKQNPVVYFEQEDIKLHCCCAKFKVQCFHLIKKLALLNFPREDTTSK